MTNHLGISQRVSDLRELGIDVKCTMRSKKNQFGNSCNYGLFFIPSNEIEQAELIYNKLSNK